MFKNGEVVCFFGDSITAAGSWEAEVFQHIRKHTDVRFYNCGISGGTAELASEYLYSFCLSKNPDTVVLSFGANDIQRELYSMPETEEVKRKKAEQFLLFTEKMDFLISSILSFGARVILFTPPPYDEFNESREKNLYCQSAFSRAAEVIRNLSKKHDCLLIDIQKSFLSIIKEKRIMLPDRLHPTQLGYHFLAQCFLVGINEIDEVSLTPIPPLEKWNQERQSAEKILKLLDFIDYRLLYRQAKERGWGTSEKIEECKRLLALEEDKTSYFAISFDAYIKHAVRREELTNELVRLTVAKRQTTISE